MIHIVRALFVCLVSSTVMPADVLSHTACADINKLHAVLGLLLSLAFFINVAFVIGVSLLTVLAAGKSAIRNVLRSVYRPSLPVYRTFLSIAPVFRFFQAVALAVDSFIHIVAQWVWSYRSVPVSTPVPADHLNTTLSVSPKLDAEKSTPTPSVVDNQLVSVGSAQQPLSSATLDQDTAPSAPSVVSSDTTPKSSAAIVTLHAVPSLPSLSSTAESLASQSPKTPTQSIDTFPYSTQKGQITSQTVIVTPSSSEGALEVACVTEEVKRKKTRRGGRKVAGWARRVKQRMRKELWEREAAEVLAAVAMTGEPIPCAGPKDVLPWAREVAAASSHTIHLYHHLL